MSLTAADIKVGRCYRAKHPAPAGSTFIHNGHFNDRQVKHVSMLNEVQYDGPAVKIGRHYPRVSMEAFLAWADRDVTDELPAGEWQEYKR